jgi:hypothetical protein
MLVMALEQAGTFEVNANFRFSGFECPALVDDACFGIEAFPR